MEKGLICYRIIKQALKPLLKRIRAHKQYSGRLTRWLDRLSPFEVNVQYAAGKNIPLTEYLSRHPIMYSDESGVDSKTDSREEMEAEEVFVIIQIIGLFEFNRTVGSITQFIERTTAPQLADQSQRCRQRANGIKPVTHWNLCRTAST